jgi:hypothetical protein
VSLVVGLAIAAYILRKSFQLGTEGIFTIGIMTLLCWVFIKPVTLPLSDLPSFGISLARRAVFTGSFVFREVFETGATQPGDLGSIHIAEALKCATSRTGGKPNVIERGPEPCSPIFLGPNRELAPVALLLLQSPKSSADRCSVVETSLEILSTPI